MISQYLCSCIGLSYSWAFSSLRLLKKQLYFNSVRIKVKGKDNEIGFKGAKLDDVTFEIIGNDNIIEIKDGCHLKNVKFYVRGNHHRVLLSENCQFYSGSSIWIEDTGGVLKVGRNSTFGFVHFAITEPNSRIEIGEDCMFASNIDVRTGDSHSIIDVGSQRRINSAENVNIGNHAWITAHCNILKGVNIPNRSVVGTGSVVTRKFFEDGVVIAGNPAKVVRSNITWSRENMTDFCIR